MYPCVDDGYRLTYLGYDFLALHTLSKRSVVSGIGPKIGVGKESDIYHVTDENDGDYVMKVHRYVGMLAEECLSVVIANSIALQMHIDWEEHRFDLLRIIGIILASDLLPLGCICHVLLV